MRMAILAALIAATAPAAASAEAGPLPASFFSGRWYEIARSPNPSQADCQAPTYDFESRPGAAPLFTLTCRKGSPSGRAERLRVKVQLPGGGSASRFRVTALGGLVGADYRVLDRDEAMTWAILSLADGKEVWLLARRPSFGGAERQTAVGRIAALGFNAKTLVFPRHGG